VQAKVQREQKWTRKSAISVCVAEIAGTILSSMEPAIGNVAVVEPPWPWSSMTLNLKITSHLRALYTHLLDILTFHYTRTQLWNQAHNRRRLSPFKHRLILSQKCQPSGEKLIEFFKRKRTRHGLLASASILCRETSLLYCRLRMKASHGSPTCGTFLVVS
jgi:hypothetical protein